MKEKAQKSKEYAEANYRIEIWQKEAMKCFEAGWDEALKNQWISTKERLPEFNERVLTLYMNDDKIDIRIMRRIKILGLKPDEIKWRWSLTIDKYGIIAWMPLPDFKEILEADKDILELTKQK